MKILMINKFLYPRGGAETYMLKLGESLSEAGHQVQYFGMKDEKNIVGNEWGLYTSNMDFHSSSVERFLYPFRIIYSMEARRKVDKLIKYFHPDIIHLNNINFQITPSVIDIAAKWKIPVIQTVHDSQMICPGHLLYQTEKNQLCTRCVEGSKWNCAKYRCIHGSFIKSLLGTIEGLFYDCKKTYDKVDMYLCPSHFIEKILCTRKRYRGKTKVLCNFIEQPEGDYGEKQDYILYFGRLSEEKGISLFLEMCRRFPQVRFKIAGSGPLDEMCKGLPNAEFLGLLTGESLKKVIAQAKLVIYPSLCYENCPLSILEAVSLGTPVLSSARGGIQELICQEETGIIVPEPFNVKALEQKLNFLLENPEKLVNMAQKCRQKSQKLMNRDSYRKELEGIYHQILRNKSI